MSGPGRPNAVEPVQTTALSRRGASVLVLLIAAALVLVPLGMPVAAAVFDVPVDDFYTVYEDHQLDVPVISGVFSNDLTTRGQCVVATDVTGLQGHLPLDSLGPDGQFQFSPNPDFNGRPRSPTPSVWSTGSAANSCRSPTKRR